jgi:GH25 family lysozyme M1 (1,4-beta-N-acetylmuramidase)
LIYTSRGFWESYMGDTTKFADDGYTLLWIAHWTNNSQPTLPANDWGGYGWTFWQYTSTGTIPGISGNVDRDWYNGRYLKKVTIH